jgi:hypothetical protein
MNTLWSYVQDRANVNSAFSSGSFSAPLLPINSNTLSNLEQCCARKYRSLLDQHPLPTEIACNRWAAEALNMAGMFIGVDASF